MKLHQNFYLVFLLLEFVTSSVLWLDPTQVRCWIQDDSKQLYYPNCPETSVTMKWVSIPTDMRTNQVLEFTIQFIADDLSSLVNAGGVFKICSEGAYDCDPTRDVNSFSISQNFNDISFNATQFFSFSAKVVDPQRYTFVFGLKLSSKLIAIGITRDVMSGNSLTYSNWFEAICTFTLPSSSNRISVKIQENEDDDGLVFHLKPSEIPSGGSYLLHVQELGDSRSLANSMGHFVGASSSSDKDFVVGAIQSKNLIITKKSTFPLKDSELRFTGVNGILGRSLLLQDTSHTPLSQCLFDRFADLATSTPPAPIPDFTSAVCVFTNGDTILLSKDHDEDSPVLVLRYVFTATAISSLFYVDRNDKVSLWDGIPLGLSSGLKVIKYEAETLSSWNGIKLQAELSLGSRKCTIVRGPRIGIAFEYPKSSKSPDSVNGVTSASCWLLPTSTVAGFVTFNVVSGASDLCSDHNGNIPCVRVDYSISGLQGDSILTVRQFGFPKSDLQNPQLQHLQIPVSYDSSRATSSGVTFLHLPLNGENSLHARALYLHQGNDETSTVLTSCVTTFDTKSSSLKVDRSALQADNPATGICMLGGVSPSRVSGSINFKYVGASSVSVEGQIQFSGDSFADTQVWFELDKTQRNDVANWDDLRYEITVADPPDDITVKFNVDRPLSDLFGMTFVLISQDGSLKLADCVIGLAPIPTHSPTKRPQTPGAPPVPPSAPSASTDSNNNNNNGITFGGFIVFLLLFTVVGGFVIVVLVAIRRRFRGRNKTQAYGAGIGEEDENWDFQVEMQAEKPKKFAPIINQDDD